MSVTESESGASVAGGKRKPETPAEPSEGSPEEKRRKELDSTVKSVYVMNISVPLPDIGFILNEVSKRYDSFSSGVAATRESALADLRASLTKWKAGTWVLLLQPSDYGAYWMRSNTSWMATFGIGKQFLTIVSDFLKKNLDGVEEINAGSTKTE